MDRLGLVDLFWVLPAYIINSSMYCLNTTSPNLRSGAFELLLYLDRLYRASVLKNMFRANLA